MLRILEFPVLPFFLFYAYAGRVKIHFSLNFFKLIEFQQFISFDKKNKITNFQHFQILKSRSLTHIIFRKP